MRLGSGPEAAAEARQAISTLRADLDPPLMETLRLLVTELVTNSVRHTAADSVTLKVAVGKSAVLTEVADTGPGFDPQSLPDPTDPKKEVYPPMTPKKEIANWMSMHLMQDAGCDGGACMRDGYASTD